MSIAQAIELEAISPLQVIRLDYSMQPEIKKIVKVIGWRRGEELTEEQRNNLATSISQFKEVSASIAQIIRQLYNYGCDIDEKRGIPAIINSNKKILVFAQGQIQALSITESFNEQDIKTVGFHGAQTSIERTNSMYAFKNDPTVTALVACEMVTEGFDIPTTEWVIDLRSYVRMKRGMIQAAGRATRLSYPRKTSKYIHVVFLPPKYCIQAYTAFEFNRCMRHMGCEKESLIQCSNNMISVEKTGDIKPIGAHIQFPNVSGKIEVGELPKESKNIWGRTRGG